MKIKRQKIPHFNKLPLLTRLLTTWFGFGLLTPAPGTWGSLGGLLSFYALFLLSQAFFVPVDAFVQFLVPVCLFLFLWGADHADKYESLTKRKDCSHIVIDEVVGLWLVLLFVLLAPGNFWVHSLLGFLLFRFFDILKPFPINWVEKKTTGGFGVMIDDILAAVYAVISFWLLGMFVRAYIMV